MAIRKLRATPQTRHNHAGEVIGAAVYYDEDWGEFRVVPTINGFEQGPKTHYHTDDREDAFGTAAAIIARLSDQ